MEDIAEIQRLKREENKTYTEICEIMGVSSKTVSKALNRPEEFVDGYRREAPYERPALGDFIERIEELLKGKDWERTKGRRVRRTSRWIYRQIRKEGFTGAESTVRTYVGSKFKQPRAACPIEHPPGDETQFDFGQYPVKIGDAVTQVHFCGATFSFSTRRFLFAYPAERQECLFDAIERTYQRAGGVTARITLDNTKLAVAKVLEGRKREETADYKRFRVLLGVAPHYTNRAAGWEKGHVEGTVGWAKRQILCGLEVGSWEELQRILDQECDQDARERRHGETNELVCELFEQERAFLDPFPYEGRRSYKRVRAKVSPGALVQVDRSKYSVPMSLRKRNVRVHLYCDEVVVTFDGEKVARHPRDWSGRGEHYVVEHYLSCLKRAPALLDHGKPFVRMPVWLSNLRDALDDDKAFIELLLAVDAGKYSIAELEGAAAEAIAGGCVTRAVVEARALSSRLVDGDVDAPPELDGPLSDHDFAVGSTEHYDELAVGA